MSTETEIVIAPEIDELLQILRKSLGQDFISTAVTESYMIDEVPSFIVDKDYWLAIAKVLRHEEGLQFTYVRNISGVDYEEHMEVVYQVQSFITKKQVIIKIKLDRDEASLDSVANIWDAANWNEREIFDLLGITFKGHPDLRRILMPDDWVGHPLRKDYVQLDEGV